MSGTITFPKAWYFVGFNSTNTTLTRKSKVYDADLVTADLLFAFNTRVGERVMRPDWGCAIWDYFMEPMTPILHDQIIAEATRICESDSRVNVQSITVYTIQNGIIIEFQLFYVPFNVYNTFTVTFEDAQTAYFSGIQGQ